MNHQNNHKNKSLNLRKLVQWLHLWPGFIASIILAFVCLTGALFVYSDEIVDLSAGEARYVKKVSHHRIPAEKLIAILKRTYPERKSPSYMIVYKDPNRSVRFNTYGKEDGLRMVYVDPYTGKILKDDPTIFFFFILAHLHSSLLLGSVGEWIIALSALVFFLELVTGLWLWFPHRWNRKAWKHAWSVNWKTSSKRTYFDLHRVLGAYAFLLLAILAGTGVIIAFDPLENAVQKLAGGTDPNDWQKGLRKTAQYPDGKERTQTTAFPLDHCIETGFCQNPQFDRAQVATSILPGPYYIIRLSNRIGLKSAENAKTLYFDTHNGQQARDIPPTILRGEKVDNLLWVLHTGNWGGPWGKLLTFLAGLIGAFLPLSGFIIWNGRRKKRKSADYHPHALIP